MQLSKLITLGVAGAALALALAGVSRAQVVQGMTSADRQYKDTGTPLYELGMEHRGVRLEVLMHTWGLSAPGFSVDIWNDDPAAAEFFDVVAARGTVTIDGQVATLVPYAPTLEHPLGGRRAIILPSWSTWPALPFTGRDVEFELHDTVDPESQISAWALGVRG